MCNTSNIPSFKERIQCYINKEDEIKKDYQNRMNALNDAATADILANCPIKVSDVYVTESNNAWGLKRQYYKVAKLEASVDGTVIVYGYKRKLDKLGANVIIYTCLVLLFTTIIMLIFMIK